MNGTSPRDVGSVETAESKVSPANPTLLTARRSKRRLLSIAHSYCIALNRRLAHEMGKVGRENWEVTAVAPSFFSGDLRPLSMERTGNEACSSESVPAYLTRYIHVMFYGWRLSKILQCNWDLVHCWEEPYIIPGGQIAMWTPKNIPLVFWTGQNIDKNYPFPFCSIENYCVNRCAGWGAYGESVLHTLLARGYGRKPHAVLPLGVELGVFHPNAAARARRRQELGWENNQAPIVGFVGRFVPEKGISLLMRSLDSIRSPWRAVFVGTGPMKEEIKRWAKRHGDRVRVLSNVEHGEVASYLN